VPPANGEDRGKGNSHDEMEEMQLTGRTADHLLKWNSEFSEFSLSSWGALNDIYLMPWHIGRNTWHLMIPQWEQQTLTDDVDSDVGRCRCRCRSVNNQQIISQQPANTAMLALASIILSSNELINDMLGWHGFRQSLMEKDYEVGHTM
jgi:hypothetical protein